MKDKIPPVLQWKGRATAAETAIEVYLRDHGNEDRCRNCGNEIWFLRGREGDWEPTNDDLSRHNCTPPRPTTESHVQVRQLGSKRPDYNKMLKYLSPEERKIATQAFQAAVIRLFYCKKSIDKP